MRKINFVDVVVISICVLIAIFVFSRYVPGYFNKNVWVFDGSDIHKAIYVANCLDNEGYEVLATIIGKWIYDGSPFNSSGTILQATQGFLLVRLDDGSIIKVGGRMATKEDVSAKKIIIKPIGITNIKIRISYIGFNDFSDFSNFVNNTCLTTTCRFTGMLILVLKNSTDVATYYLLRNFLLKEGIVNYCDAKLWQNGISLYVVNLKLQHVDKLKSILYENNVTASKIALSDGNLIITYNYKLSNEDITKIRENFLRKDFVENVFVIQEPYVE